MATNFGRSIHDEVDNDVRWQHGDFTDDGVVDLGDLAKLATFFGQSQGGGGAAASGGDADLLTEAAAGNESGALVVNTDAKIDSDDGGDVWDHIGSLLDDDNEAGLV